MRLRTERVLERLGPRRPAVGVRLRLVIVCLRSGCTFSVGIITAGPVDVSGRIGTAMIHAIEEVHTATGIPASAGIPSATGRSRPAATAPASPSSTPGFLRGSLAGCHRLAWLDT